MESLNKVLAFLKGRMDTRFGLLLMKIVDVAKSCFAFLNSNLESKNAKEAKKEQAEAEKKAKQVCDKGSLDDLFDLKKFNKSLCIAFCLFLVCGCGKTVEISCQTTKAWEGHYFTIKEFQQATKDLELERGESVWVLSNRSLYRVISNTGSEK